TEPVKREEKRNLSIPFGVLDIPSLQSQEVYHYDLEESSHTVLFASPGFGKSTALQTLVMNLARQNTPEQVQFNLFDFGTNGLLPLKELPHVADIVTLEENEKLQKMLQRLEQNLAERKALFKKVGVANLKQYQSKTQHELPIIVNVLDSYDGLSPNDNRKDTIDNLLLKVLREGAAVGIYLVLTAGRYNAIRMNMMANIQTKMALFLNEDGDLSNLFGREKLEQVELPGRAQIKLEQPLALQIFLPTREENEVDALAALDREIVAMKEEWKGAL
ncbi:MAG TPA: type VII secretion protein EssC, partial [Lactococcus sp.]|nr:type VII secretion protein EssC [Lactococcus sp.]